MLSRNKRNKKCWELANQTYVSKHALAAYRKHHPASWVPEILRGISHGSLIDSDLALVLVGRKLRDTKSIYIIAPDRSGMFVIEPEEEIGERYNRPYTLITYLRFSLPQKEFAMEQWGNGLEDTWSAKCRESYQQKSSEEEHLEDTEEDSEEWFKESGISFYKMEIEKPLFYMFGSKNKIKLAIKRAISLKVDMNIDTWEIQRDLQDPMTGKYFSIKYQPGNSRFIKVFTRNPSEEGERKAQENKTFNPKTGGCCV